MERCTRRTVLRGIAAGMLASTAGLHGSRAQDEAKPLCGAIVRNGTPEALTERAVEALGEWAASSARARAW